MMRLRSLDAVFAVLERTALSGERCPHSHWERGHDQPKIKPPDLLIDSGALTQLAKDGKIRIEISGKNYRQVTILTGPHAGKQTAPNPDPQAHVWQTTSAAGNSRAVAASRARPGPSAPRGRYLPR